MQFINNIVMIFSFLYFRFAFEGEARGAAATAELVIDTQHASWKALIDMELYAPFVCYINTRLENSACYVSLILFYYIIFIYIIFDPINAYDILFIAFMFFINLLTYLLPFRVILRQLLRILYLRWKSVF